MIPASVVFPTPGGPQKIMDGTMSFSISCRRILPFAQQMLLTDIVLQRQRAACGLPKVHSSLYANNAPCSIILTLLPFHHIIFPALPHL